MDDLPSYESAMAAEKNDFTSRDTTTNTINENDHESYTKPSASPVPSEEYPTTSVPSEEYSTTSVPSEKYSTTSVPSEKYLTPPEPSKLPSAPPVMPTPHFHNTSSMPQAVQPTFGSLTDEYIRKACYDFAERHFKNASSIIEHMRFSNIRSCYSLHYKFETFWETRESVIKNGKYDGKPIDGSSNGPEPNIRSIFVLCKQKFRNGEHHVVIPHSEHLRNCRKCDDRGKEDCFICKGAGWNHCSSCSGDGYLKDRTVCSTCNKTGRLICDPCYSSGRINCRECGGYKKLKSHKELKVTWTNHVDEFDINPTDIPMDILKSSTSSEIFSEESPRVQPLTLFPDAAINIASLNFVFKHQKECANKNVLLQRHSIRAIPITKITYSCKGKTGEFYVYGIENSVYFENFPTLMDCIS